MDSPVRSFTIAVLPWSTCPTVPMFTDGWTGTFTKTLQKRGRSNGRFDKRVCGPSEENVPGQTRLRILGKNAPVRARYSVYRSPYARSNSASSFRQPQSKRRMRTGSMR